MNIRMKEVVEALSHFKTEFYIPFSEYDSINNLVLVEGDLKAINPNLLYLCDDKRLKQFLTLDCCGNVLCVLKDTITYELAKNTKLNVIVVRSSENIMDIYNMIFQLILEKEDYLSKTMKLVQSHLSCKGLQNIIDTAREVFGNPLFISDLAYNILGYNKSVNVDDPTWRYLSESGFDTYERLKKINDSGAFERLYKSNVPLIETFDYSSLRWMAYKIMINGKIAGHIALVEAESSFKTIDSDLLKFLCRIVANELQKDALKNYKYGKAYEYFFIDLLEDKIPQYKLSEERIKTFDIHFNEDLYVVTIYQNQHVSRGLYLEYIKNHIDYLLQHALSIVYKNQIVILLNQKKEENPFTGEEYEKFMEFLDNNHLNAGISQCFHDIAHFKKHYIQSTKAIELGCHLKQEIKLFDYNDYSIYHLMNIAQSQFDLKTFCNPLLFHLIKYDKEFNTNYTQTLYVYLLNECNVMKASQVFHIHRNSMKYRIKKIEEILNITLNSTQTKLSFFLAFKILTYIGEHNFYIL